MDDPRIPKYRDATLAMTRGRFDVDIPFDHDDELGRLGHALHELGQVLERRFEELRALVHITEKVNAGLLLEEVVDHIFESIHPVIPYDRIGVALIEEADAEDGDRGARTRVVARYARSRASEIKLGSGYGAALEGSSLATILETGEPRILNDLPAYLAAHPGSHSTRLIVAEGMRSSLTCPLIAMGKKIGFIFFSSAKTDTYRDAHVALYQQIAGQISVVIEKGNLYQRLLQLTRELEQRNTFIRNAFGRYISDEVVEELLGSPAGLELGGVKREVTVLLSDLRGFTTLSEELPPDQVVGILNAYLSAMVDIILGYRGTIKEFEGDAVLVVFGAPIPCGDHARRAIACALEMQAAMPQVNAQNRERGWPEIEMGIGISTGEAVVGNIGSERRAQYGVIGATVNRAARIESFTVGGQILASEATAAQAGADLRRGQRIEIRAKGVLEPIGVYEVTGIGDEDEPAAGERADPWVTLDEPLPVRWALVVGSHVDRERQEGRIVQLSRRKAMLTTDRPPAPYADICIWPGLDRGAQAGELLAPLYAKVTAETHTADRVVVHLTAVPREVRSLLRQLTAG
jgi:class 3 adenylate cyclase